MAYLRGHYEPSDEAEVKRLSQRTRGYVISQGELYKSGVVTPWLKCIPVAQGVRPGTAGLLVDIECSRVSDSSWMYLTSFVTT